MKRQGMCATLGVLVFLVSLFYVFGSVGVFAQDAGSVSSRRAQLEAELVDLEKQIEAQRKVLDSKQKERVSLERDVAILTAEINKAKLSIRARNLSIEKLTGEIKSKEYTIGVLTVKIEREKDSLAELIRKTNEIQSYTLAEFLLTKENVSSFFEDVDRYSTIRISLYDSYTVIEGDKKETEEEKHTLEDKKAEEVDLRAIQELQKKRLEEKEREKQRLVQQTKGLEKEYQKILVNTEKGAAAIRTELFTLRGSVAIPFERALTYANQVATRTGVRPAFLLGIIAEESNLGANVGTGNWRVDMKAPRDTEPFLDITRRLGLDPDKMPVSKKPWYGYGGAMGPAQFIPSTWVMYESRIAAATGHTPPNPWDPYDAFTASGILLADSGANKKTVVAERYAALCYLAGCRNAGKSAYQFYADDVMELALKYQRQIDILNTSQ